MLDFYNFSAGLIHEDYLYFSSIRLNALYRRCLNNQKVELLAFFDGEGLLEPLLHKACLAWNDEIIFMPERASSIHLFNTIMRSQRSIPISQFRDNKKNADGVLVGDSLFLFPANPTRPLICVDLKLGTVKEIHCFSAWCSKNLVYSEEDLVFARSFRKGNKIYLGIYGRSMVLEFDCDSYECRTIKLPIDKLFSIFKVDNDIWALPLTDDYFVRFNESWDVIGKYTCPNLGSGYSRKYNELLKVGNSIYALPAEAEYILKLDESNGVFTKWKDYPKGFRFYDGENMKFFRYDFFAEDAYLFSRNNNAVLRIDSDKDLLDVAWMNDFSIDEYWEQNPGHLHSIQLMEHSSGWVCHESEMIDLKRFIKCLE